MTEENTNVEGTEGDGTGESTPSPKRVSMTEGLRARHEAEKAKKAAEGAEPKEDDDSENDEPLMGEREEDEQQPAVAKGGYKLDVPDEVPVKFLAETTEHVEQAGALAKELGVEQGVVQEITDAAVAFAVSDQSGVNIEDADACGVVLRAMYGDESDKIVTDAQKAVKRLGPKIAE